MIDSLPQLVSITPTVLDSNRVSLDLRTTNFPQQSNVLLNFDLGHSPTQSLPPEPKLADPESLINDSLYPNVELRILDPENNEVAQLFIVEHKEEFVSMTMHIRNPQPGKIYLAQADLIHRQERLQTLTTPFKLSRQTEIDYD